MHEFCVLTRFLWQLTAHPNEGGKAVSLRILPTRQAFVGSVDGEAVELRIPPTHQAELMQAKVWNQGLPCVFRVYVLAC
jgi:hypothetical protein